ncbi:MAG: hypothetical protein RJB38_282 [Pseudomonadota bacterium]|jgi:CRP-like cAMP-binding protein
MASETLTVDAFSNVPLFSCFSRAELARLLNLGQVKSVEPFTNVMIEGELSWGMYLVLEGQVGVYKVNPITGASHEVGQLQSGAFFGEMSLIDELPRSATVQSLTTCRLFFVDKEAFQRVMLSTPDLRLRFAESCMRLLVGRLRVLNDDYVVSQYQLWHKALGSLRGVA